MRVASISLFAIDGLDAILFAYQNLSKCQVPYVIPKEKALQIVYNQGNWTETNFAKMTVTSMLYHIVRNGVPFKVDEKTLRDTQMGGIYHEYPDTYEIYYVWQMDIQAQYGQHHLWRYTVNGTNGQILQSMAY